MRKRDKFAENSTFDKDSLRTLFVVKLIYEINLHTQSKQKLIYRQPLLIAHGDEAGTSAEGSL